MKRWIQWGVTTVLASSVVGLTPGANRALALTQTEIIQKLQTVPVFTLADNDGNPVLLPILERDTQAIQSFLGIFISPSDAQETLATLQAEITEANQLNAVSLPLANVYNMIISSQVEDIPPVVFIPQNEQLELAAQILENQGVNEVVTAWPVPLFYLISTTDDTYIPMSWEESDRTFIPLFFDGNEAQSLLNQLNQQASNNTEPAPNIELRVIFLDQWLQALETNDEEVFQLFELFPIPLRQQQSQPLPEQPTSEPPASEQPLPEPPASEPPLPEQPASEQPLPEPPAPEQSQAPLDEADEAPPADGSPSAEPSAAETEPE